jgi:predicted membrane protein (TIGR00267 family)
MNEDLSRRVDSLAQHEDHQYHGFHDPHRQASALSNVILGGQDGLVNVLGVILGVAAATQDSRIVLAAGMAATIAESVAMGAVAFTSNVADQEFYESEREREKRHIETVPLLEEQEIREIYQAKGFEGELLERIVKKITEDKDVWVNVMLAEEHRLAPITRKVAAKAAVIVGFAALVGSLIPLIPFFFFSVVSGIWVSLFVSGLALFGFGAYKAKKTVGHPMRSGIELFFIGMIAAAAGYVVGLLFQVPNAI